MDYELLKKVIEDQRNEIEMKFREENIIEREGITENKKFLKAPFVFITTGVRRCGKSIFSILLVRGEKHGYVNFDDERLRGLDVSDLDKVLEAMYYLYGDLDYIILDEIQNIPGWELFVNRLQRTKRVIVTGSNARLMSRELSTHLTGRYVDFRLHPFSFREFLEYNRFKPNIYLTTSIAKTKRYLDEYIKIGGIPDAYKFGERFLLTMYNDILNRDILSRYRIRYQKGFYEMLHYLVSNYSCEFSYNRLSNIGKVKNVNTIKNYVSYLENSFLIFEVKRFSYKLKEQNLAPRKIYCIDSGLIHAVGFSISENKGRLMENIVAVELERYKSADPKQEIYYWKDHQQNEVDFIVKKGKRIMECIQVTYASDPIDIEKREMRSLLKASKELKCKKLLVITWDYEDTKDGIGYIPLWKWLLGS